MNLTGGKTRDGGSIVGASVFYSNPPEEPENQSKDEVDKLNKELKVSTGKQPQQEKVFCQLPLL